MEQEKPGKPFEERRKYVRLQTGVGVKYTIIGKPGEVRAFSKDISAGGLCLVLSDELTEQTPLQLEIKIPDLKDAIAALARVIWQKKFTDPTDASKVCFHTGVEFTGISDFDRFNINRYVLENIESQQ